MHCVNKLYQNVGVEHWIRNVNYVNSPSLCDVTKSAHLVTMTTIGVRECIFLGMQKIFAQI